MKIKYTFVTGEEIEIEVDDTLSQEIEQIDNKEENNNRREGRRHQSYSNDNDKRDSFVDETVDVERNVLQNIENAKLKAALDKLLPQQQELVRKVYFENISITEIAKGLGITKQACNDRLNKIYKRLKKLL